MTKAADLALGKIAALKTALIEFTDGDDAIAVADAGVVTLLTSAVATSEGGAVTTNIAQGLAKHWAQTDNFGNTDDSLNLASLTDVAVGQSRLTITNNFSAVNNSAVIHQYYSVDTEFDTAASQSAGGVKTTSTISISSKRTASNGYLDTAATGNVCSMVHGDLA